MSMTQKIVNSQEFEKYLNEMVGVKITNFYYIVDRYIVFEGGGKVQKPLYGDQDDKRSEAEPEYKFVINGDWDYFKDGNLVETSKVKKGEDGKAFRHRMFDFEGSIAPKSISKVEVSADGQKAKIYLEDGGIFSVNRDKEMFVSFYRYINDIDIFRTHHAEVDEDTDELTYFEATKKL